MKNLNEILKLEWEKDSSDYTLTDGDFIYGSIYSSSEKGCFNIEVTKFGEQELQKDGYTLKRKKEEIKKFHVKGIKKAQKEAFNLLTSLYANTKKENNSGELTKMETEMLVEIMECEVDGLDMGFSEFDGRGLTPTQKGVLSSLIKKGMVYDSEVAYCSKSNPTRDRLAKEYNIIKENKGEPLF